MSDKKVREEMEELREEIVERAKLRAIPLDYDQLIEDGILARRSARWYQVLVSKDDLPEHVSSQADALEIKDGKLFIRLPKSWTAAQKHYRRLAGKSYDED